MMMVEPQPQVIAELSVLAKRPPRTLPRFMRHIHLSESYQLALRSLTAAEFNGPLGTDLDTQELWLSRIVFAARDGAQWAYVVKAGEFKGVVSGWPESIARRIGVPMAYLTALADTGQLGIYAFGIVFRLKIQAQK